MATYVPNATEATEPLASRSVESAALEFRTLKASITARIGTLETADTVLDARIDDLEAAVAAIVVGGGGGTGVPGTLYTQYFSGTGSQVAYTILAAPPSTFRVDIYIQGLYQQHNTFTVVGTTVTFSEAPVAGTNNIEVRISSVDTVEELILPPYPPPEVTLNNAVTLSSKTLANPVVTNYVETLYAPAAGSSFTVDLANGTLQKFTTNANTIVALPASAAGKSYSVIIAYGGVHTLSFSGGTNIKWAGGVIPAATSANGKFDIFVFTCDGTNTYARSGGSNF